MKAPQVRIARRLRKTQTSAEENLWKQLRNRRFEGLKFRRQVQIAGSIVDFACLDLGLTIELDGVHHTERQEADAARRRAIERHGFLELRFTNDEVRERLDWVLREIGRAVDVARGLAARTPYPRFEA